ncbi:MAG TPA: ATP-binding protein [Ardenticatenaceae bacterium]|nr:ATP-binding protein [Ardenticatenaceae bacterium]
MLNTLSPRAWRGIALQTLPVAALVAGLVLALAVTAFVLGAPRSDVVDLLRFLLLSSLPSLLVGFGLFALLRARLRLRGQIVLTHALGLTIVLANVIVTARLMFISPHDLALLAVLLIFAAILSLAVGVTLAASLTRNLERLGLAAEAIAAGDYAARVAHADRDEVGELGIAFNRMATRVEEAFERERAVENARLEMVAAISHDLRTPVASTRVMVEAVLDDVVPDEATANRYLVAARTELERLGVLIDDLFELARLETGPLEMELLLASLEDLVSDTLQSMQPQARACGIHLEGFVDENIGLVRMNPQQIQRVLYNLVQNAIRHTPGGGTVAIRARSAPGAVEVAVVDTGEGIAAEDLPRVFERFYRGEKSRSRTTGGSGLGLAIARGIVEAHGGRIWAESRPGEGTTLRFTLPAAPAG